jgi:hypothetical protein
MLYLDAKKVLPKIGGKRPGKRCKGGWISADKKCSDHKDAGGKLTAAGKSAAAELAAKIRERKGLQPSQRLAQKVQEIRKDPKDLFDPVLVSKVASAYSHSTSNPRAMARMERQDFHDFVDKVKSLLQNSPVPSANVAKDLEAAAKEYLSKRSAVFTARASTYSSFIAGGSNFNLKQAGKRSSALDRQEELFSK